jgi:hypothetical protein
MGMPHAEWLSWCRRRRAYYAALATYFAAAAFYFGPNLYLFGKLTWLEPSDFVPVVQERCVPVVLAMKQYERDRGRLPTRDEDLEPDYLPEIRGGVFLDRHGGFECWGKFNHFITYNFTPGGEGWHVTGAFTSGPIPLPPVDLPPAPPHPTATRPATEPGREP